MDPDIVLEACMKLVEQGFGEGAATTLWRANFPKGAMPSFVRKAAAAVEPVAIEATEQVLGELAVKAEMGAFEGALEVLAREMMSGGAKTLTQQEFIALVDKLGARTAEKVAERMVARWTLRSMSVQAAKGLTAGALRALGGILNVILITPPAGAATLDDHRKWVEQHKPVTITTIRRQAYAAYRFRCLVYALWTGKKVAPLQENAWFAIYFGPALKKALVNERERRDERVQRLIEQSRRPDLGKI